VCASLRFVQGRFAKAGAGGCWGMQAQDVRGESEGVEAEACTVCSCPVVCAPPMFPGAIGYAGLPAWLIVAYCAMLH
jgi:hypothetical protein